MVQVEPAPLLELLLPALVLSVRAMRHNAGKDGDPAFRCMERPVEPNEPAACQASDPSDPSEPSGPRPEPAQLRSEPRALAVRASVRRVLARALPHQNHSVAVALVGGSLAQFAELRDVKLVGQLEAHDL